MHLIKLGLNERKKGGEFQRPGAVVGERSTVKLLEIPVKFLQEPDWHLRSEYDAVQKSTRNLFPLNASCERALGTSRHRDYSK